MLLLADTVPSLPTSPEIVSGRGYTDLFNLWMCNSASDLIFQAPNPKHSILRIGQLHSGGPPWACPPPETLGLVPDPQFVTWQLTGFLLYLEIGQGCFKRTASKHVYYQGWNRSPAQVGCMRQALGPGALGGPGGCGWRGRWEGGSGWGRHVNSRTFHFNLWQNSLQIKKNKKNKKKKEIGQGGVNPADLSLWSVSFHFKKNFFFLISVLFHWASMT